MRTLPALCSLWEYFDFLAIFVFVSVSFSSEHLCPHYRDLPFCFLNVLNEFEWH